MSPTTLRTISIIAATLLVGCDDPTRLLAPSAPRSSLGDGSGGGTRIAFRSIAAHCGVDMNAGCGGDEEYGWGWSTWTSLATIDTDGTGGTDVTYPVEDNALSRTLNPAWAPDGMRLAFDESGEILVVAGAGGTARNLTRHAANDVHPAWSPDGGRIAFLSDRGGRPELYVMSAVDGSNVTRLTSGVGFAGDPDWSADGERILFTCVVEADDFDICAVNADGTGFVRLTSAPGFDGMADWSPSGRIAFLTARFGAAGDLAVMNGDGSGVTRLGAGIAGEDPDWSPDGGRLAYSANLYVYAVGADGSSPMQIARGTHPSWRPTDAPLPAIQPPVARITALGCLELTCTFDGTGSTDDAGTRQISHAWSSAPVLGTSSAPTWKQTFPQAGTYTVALTVMAWATGKTATTTQSVTVTGLPAGAPPVASFTTSCAGLTCTLDATASTDDAAVVKYSWKLGTKSGDTATGRVVTTAFDAEGARTVVLTVTDGAGQTNSTTRTFYAAPIPGDAPPVARLSVICDGLTCRLDGRGSTDDNYVQRHYIDTGAPGSTPIWASALTTIYATGTYTVTLTVFDDVGQMGRVYQTITVAPVPPPNQPPVAAFTYTCVRTKCTFDGRASTDDQGIVSYSWNLGSASGSNLSGAVVTHDYRRAGSYTARLTVRDAAGLLGSVAQVVTVTK